MEVRPERTETILFVDDDELVRKSAVILIASLGYRVLSARSGPEALEILRQDTSIDLLFHRHLHARRIAWPATCERGASAAAGTEVSLHFPCRRRDNDFS